MKKTFFLCILGVGIVWGVVGVAAAEPQQGILVSETGDLIEGYSPVIVDNGLAYPVRSPEYGRWYEVVVIHRSADGTILCTIGEPLGEIPEGVAADEADSGDEVVDDGTTDPE